MFCFKKNIFFCLKKCLASSFDSLKRARVTASSLIPFPRVGRSVDAGGRHLFLGQKRTGKSSLIPFPRVGRAGAATWGTSVEKQTKIF